jgi:hypothetical protein
MRDDDEYTCTACVNHFEVSLLNGESGEIKFCPWCGAPRAAGRVGVGARLMLRRLLCLIGLHDYALVRKLSRCGDARPLHAVRAPLRREHADARDCPLEPLRRPPLLSGAAMSEDVKPALTPEEWAGLLAMDQPTVFGDAGGHVAVGKCALFWDAHSGNVLCDDYDAPRQHALAAIALHGQPFGFTWEDATFLRILALAGPGESLSSACCEHLDALAARIAALLPPEGV